MKATGIVRRIDDLGRIVIPKEVRRTLGIEAGDPLELFTENNSVIFRKYAPIDDDILIKLFSVVELSCQGTGDKVAIYDANGYIVKASEGETFARKVEDDTHAERKAVYVPSSKALGCYIVGSSVPTVAVSLAEMYLDK